MGRKSKPKVTIQPFCFYCDREFDDEKTLIMHQKAKHFKCVECHKKMATTTALNTHMQQVHKEKLTKVPNALEGRDSLDFEIFGMEGVPEEYLTVERSGKRQRVHGVEDGTGDDEAPNGSAGAAAPAAPTYGMPDASAAAYGGMPGYGMGPYGGFPGAGMPGPAMVQYGAGPPPGMGMGYPGMPGMPGMPGFPMPMPGQMSYGMPGMPGMPPGAFPPRGMPGFPGMPGMPGAGPAGAGMPGMPAFPFPPPQGQPRPGMPPGFPSGPGAGAVPPIPLPGGPRGPPMPVVPGITLPTVPGALPPRPAAQPLVPGAAAVPAIALPMAPRPAGTGMLSSVHISGPAFGGSVAGSVSVPSASAAHDTPPLPSPPTVGAAGSWSAPIPAPGAASSSALPSVPGQRLVYTDESESQEEKRARAARYAFNPQAREAELAELQAGIDAQLARVLGQR